MDIRKIIYNIDYIHLIQFREHYKNIISPYFVYDPLEYGIEGENTINERVKLIFRPQGVAYYIRKEGLTMWFEGDCKDLLKSNPEVARFFDIYEKITQIPGFAKVTRHRLMTYGFSLKEENTEEKYVDPGNIITNPFGQLDEYAAIYEFTDDDKKLNVKFGNYTSKDIVKFKLMEINKNSNKMLEGKIGHFCEISVTEPVRVPSFAKFKDLLRYSQSQALKLFK
jgi:hypothetical protein